MDSEYIQFIRYKLQKRLKRLNTSDHQSFRFTMAQVWSFLQQNELTKGILDDLELRSQNLENFGDETLSGNPQVGTTESENDSICYWVCKKCATSENDHYSTIGFNLNQGGNLNDGIEAFRITYLEPLFDYIDEHLDDKRMILALLRKFKHRCEWFRRKDLFDAFTKETSRGEGNLASRLYEYLHDQGVQFQVEPQSASGRIDLISNQTGRDRLVADAKLFNPERGQDKGYIIKGFRQIYDYTRDFNEPFGYLVIFKLCEQDLSIPTQHQESSVPFITHNNKTIFLLVIDIFDYQKQSASKRGKLQAHEITPEQFVKSLDEPIPGAQPPERTSFGPSPD